MKLIIINVIKIVVIEQKLTQVTQISPKKVYSNYKWRYLNIIKMSKWANHRMEIPTESGQNHHVEKGVQSTMFIYVYAYIYRYTCTYIYGWNICMYINAANSQYMHIYIYIYIYVLPVNNNGKRMGIGYFRSTADKYKNGYFPTNDIQTPAPLSFDPVVIDDAQCAETNEKYIFRFLFF